MNCPLEAHDFFSEQTLSCPFDFYRELHREAPVYPVPGTDIYVVSRHEHIRKLLKQTDLYSNDISAALNIGGPSPEAAAVLAQGWKPANTLLTMDPPGHKTYRSLLNKVFSARRVEQMHDYVETITDELVDAFIERGECEFVGEFCVPLPVYIIADQLGVPRSDLALFKRWSDASAAQLGRYSDEQGSDAEVENARLIVEFQHYFVDKLAERRQSPRDDIISDLARAEIDDGRPLTTEELLSLLQQLLVAGNETTTSSIAGGLWQLLQYPEQMAKLRAEPALIANAVEEMLRLESPTAGMWRLVTRDTELHGVLLPAGSKVMLRFAAANRDPEQFDAPECMDVSRDNASSHLAFGQGIHFCLGAMLARKEMQVAFSKLLGRLDNIRLAEDKPEPAYWPNLLLRGLDSLHIRFDKRTEP